jgi:type IX secretion system PorP/SprF family membrane protein
MKYLLITFLIFPLAIFSQQEAQIANFSNSPFITNPAAGGLTDVMQFELIGRTQWIGYNGGPKTLFATGNSQINLGKSTKVLSEYNVKDQSFFAMPEITTGTTKHIVGGTAYSDAIGPFSRTSITGSYAIHLPFTKKLNFGAGLGLGWSNFKVNQDRVVLHQTEDDPYSLFLTSTSAQNILNANGGIVVYNDKLFFSLSTTQALGNQVVFNTVQTESNFNRHYFAIVKYKVGLNDQFDLEPNIATKLVGNSPISLDFGSKVIYNQSTWASFQYRTSNSLVMQIGTTLVKNLYFSYSYELSIAKMATSNTGTHEVLLGFYLGKNRNVDNEIKSNQNTKEE